MSSAKTVLVLGGTGHYGQYIVRALTAKNVPVRVLSRNAAKARLALGPLPQVMEGDLQAEATMARALDGAAGMIVSISAIHPRQIRQFKAIEQDAVIAALEQAGRAHVERVVYISVYDINKDVAARVGLASAGIKQAVEQFLAQSDLNWTILGAPPSMELFFAMLRGNKMMVPGGGPKALPSISPVDLGELAAQAVLRQDLSGQRFRAPGPDTLSFPEAARRLSLVYGREIRVRKIPLILPRIVGWLTRPLAPVSDLMLYVHTMTRFIELLNLFPPDLAAAAEADHRRLLDVFEYTPTTLEQEARRRQAA